MDDEELPDGHIRLENGNIIDQRNLPTEYNGLPISRKLKDVGIRQLPKKIIPIYHPIGLKLFKCVRGYIILCTEKDCLKHGWLPDIKCKTHYKSYRICEICRKGATFGFQLKKPLRCKDHIIGGMINVRYRKCEYANCQTLPCYGFKEDGIKRFCASHKENGMTDIRNKKCEYKNCEKVSSFGFKNIGIKRYCAIHKENGMINIKKKKCEYANCEKLPCFGLRENRKPRFCSAHKENGMIYINKKCEHENCEKQPSFGFKEDGIWKFCLLHKENGMINVRDRKCAYENCEIRPSYMKLCTTTKIHCVKHATLNEYSAYKNRPICMSVLCINKAYYFDMYDKNIYPVRCSDHKLSNDIELIFKQCSKCLDSLYFPVCQEYCMECGRYRDFKMYKFREMYIKEFLLTNNIQFIHDKRVSINGSQCRPDFLISTKFGWIILEVDERQHAYSRYTRNKELARMKIIYDDVQLVKSGHQVVFIRYNPDDYITNTLKHTIKQRMSCLYNIIVHLMILDNIPSQLTVVYLYYDGYNDNPMLYSIPLNIEMFDIGEDIKNDHSEDDDEDNKDEDGEDDDDDDDDDPAIED